VVCAAATEWPQAPAMLRALWCVGWRCRRPCGLPGLQCCALLPKVPEKCIPIWSCSGWLIGYGRACVAAKRAAGSLEPDYNIITFQRSLRGNGTLETTAVSEESLQWEAVSPFKTQDSVMVLAYAIIMLTTNLHSPNVKEKMKKHEFIKQNRGVNGNDENFPGDFLSKVYDDMQREKLTVMRNVN